RFAEDHGGADAQLPAGAQDAHGNLAAVGDEDLAEHGESSGILARGRVAPAAVVARRAQSAGEGERSCPLEESGRPFPSVLRMRMGRMRRNPAYSGMFPCFFRGFWSRLFSRDRRATITRSRVSDGSITAST